MADIRWEFIIPALMAGGVLGALIVGLFRSGQGRGLAQGRMQPVGLKITANPIFPPMKHEKAADTNATLKYKDTTFLASSLFLVEFQVVNMGNRDFREFKFGITLPGNHNAIASNNKPPDRDHVIEENPRIIPEAWAKEAEFTLRPFNMHDSYSLMLYIHVGGKGGDIGEITPSTAEPVTFVDLPALGEKLEEAIRLLGPIPFE